MLVIFQHLTYMCGFFLHGNGSQENIILGNKHVIVVDTLDQINDVFKLT